MIYLYAIALATLILLTYMRFEAGFLKVRRLFFTKNSKGLKIAHISDIHINRLKVSSSKISSVLRKEKPDLLIITGDCIETPSDVNDFVDFLNEIKCGIRTILCFGNHDYKAFRGDKKGLESFKQAIENTGTTILHNNTVCIEKNLKMYSITGIEDLREGCPDMNKAFISCCKDAYLNIAISHNPDIIWEIPKGKVDYLFCGHFHGGQIWVPFGLEFKILRRDRLCRMGIKRGLHRLNRITLYINSGLGNVAVPLRFLSRPEISIYQLP